MVVSIIYTCHLILLVSLSTGQKTHAASIICPYRLDREDNEMFVGNRGERNVEELRNTWENK
jgi:hypothetical protein